MNIRLQNKQISGKEGKEGKEGRQSVRCPQRVAPALAYVWTILLAEALTAPVIFLIAQRSSTTAAVNSSAIMLHYISYTACTIILASAHGYRISS